MITHSVKDGKKVETGPGDGGGAYAMDPEVGVSTVVHIHYYSYVHAVKVNRRDVTNNEYLRSLQIPRRKSNYRSRMVNLLLYYCLETINGSDISFYHFESKLKIICL